MAYFQTHHYGTRQTPGMEASCSSTMLCDVISCGVIAWTKTDPRAHPAEIGTMSAWRLIWQTPRWSSVWTPPPPPQPLRISQNLYKNLMTWFRSRLCCGSDGMSGPLLLWLPLSLHIRSSFVPFPICPHPSFLLSFLPLHHLSSWAFLAFSNSSVFNLLVSCLRSVSLLPINRNSIRIELHKIFVSSTL